MLLIYKKTHMHISIYTGILILPSRDAKPRLIIAKKVYIYMF